MTSDEKEYAIKKIQTLKELLSLSVPADDQQQFGEYTKYLPVFSMAQRETIKNKIMEIIKSL